MLLRPKWYCPTTFRMSMLGHSIDDGMRTTRFGCGILLSGTVPLFGIGGRKWEGNVPDEPNYRVQPEIGNFLSRAGAFNGDGCRPL